MDTSIANAPPEQLDGAKVLYWCPLLEENRGITGIAICQYDGEENSYLFSCDRQLRVLEDTYHFSVEEATEQVRFWYPDDVEKLQQRWA